MVTFVINRDKFILGDPGATSRDDVKFWESDIFGAKINFGAKNVDCSKILHRPD